jgi:hypothetical protein
MAFPIRAKFAHPEAGRKTDAEKCAQLLTVGEIYTVRQVNVGRSSSTVELYDVPHELFNSVMFDAAISEDEDAEPGVHNTTPDVPPLHPRRHSRGRSRRIAQVEWMLDEIGWLTDLGDYDLARRAAEQEAIHGDLRDLLQALGMFDGARPESPHQVMQKAIAEVRDMAEMLRQERA